MQRAYPEGTESIHELATIAGRVTAVDIYFKGVSNAIDLLIFLTAERGI